ncbi:MAG: hypothetical protein OEY14_14945, partial [Myxococcales bacterium]|nr:hypothetical protein [Myxococcales bacterium]
MPGLLLALLESAWVLLRGDSFLDLQERLGFLAASLALIPAAFGLGLSAWWLLARVCRRFLPSWGESPP